VKEKAAEVREEYRQKLRENKRKIKESLQNRPSLLDRHDKAIAVKNAKSNALHKVADAVSDKYKSSIDDDDLFDHKEKLLLGLSNKSGINQKSESKDDNSDQDKYDEFDD
jgi:hypothetical protein